MFRGRDLVILGGGDSALDWTLALAACRSQCRARASAQRVSRRACLRVAALGIARCGPVDVLEGQVRDIIESDGELSGVHVTTPDGLTRAVALEQLLVFWGLHPKLGPIAEWGLALNRKTVSVDAARFQTNIPGIFAVGDINDYPGKKKLILSGFHEAALAAFAVREYLRPGRKASSAVHDDEPAVAEAARHCTAAARERGQYCCARRLMRLRTAAAAR